MRIYHESNDTVLVWCGIAHFEHNQHNFLPKIMNLLLNRVNVTNSNMMMDWFNEGITRLQRHHARLMWSCFFENIRAKGYINFCPKSCVTLFYMVNATNTNISVNWCNEDVARLQRYHARLMYCCPLRQHSSQMLHEFWPKIMIHAFAQDIYEKFKYKCELV